MKYRIDNLQYCNWSRDIFQINREANLDAVHVTLVYHEDYDEFIQRTKEWEKFFSENSDLIFLGKSFKDIENAKLEKKTAIFFGFQKYDFYANDFHHDESHDDVFLQYLFHINILKHQPLL